MAKLAQALQRLRSVEDAITAPEVNLRTEFTTSIGEQIAQVSAAVPGLDGRMAAAEMEQRVMKSAIAANQGQNPSGDTNRTPPARATPRTTSRARGQVRRVPSLSGSSSATLRTTSVA